MKLTRGLWPLGLATALVYALAFTLPYWLPTYYRGVQDEIYQFAARQPWRGMLFYVALAVLFGLYLAAYRLLRQPGQPRAGVWAVGLWALVFCLLLIPVQPITSSDVYGYVFQGRIVAVLGENPFAHLYKDFAADAFYFCVTFHHLPAVTGYGPLWITITAALGWLAREQLLLNLLLFKGLAAALFLLGSVLVYAALRPLAPGRRVAGMLFYAWSPLLLYELVGNAHNDAAVAFLVLLGLYCLGRNWWWATLPCLAAAALIKPVVVLWLPLVAVWLLARCPGWPARLKWAGVMAGLVIVPVVVAYAPFWAGRDTFQGLLMQSDIHGNSLPNLLIWGLREVWPGDPAQVVQGVKLLTVLVFAPFYLWQMSLVWRPGPGLPARLQGAGGEAWDRLMRASFDVMLFYLLFVGFQFWPWYLTWLMVPAALLDEPGFGLRRLWVVVLCMVTPLLYFPFGWQWATSRLPGWGIALLAALPLLGLGLWWAIHLWRHHLARRLPRG